MFRTILALVGGLLTGFCLVMLGHLLTFLVFPMPANLNWEDQDAMAAYIATMPDSAFLLVLLSHALGPLGGGCVAALIAKRGKVLHALVVGLFFFIGGLENLREYPRQPLWVKIADPAMYLPVALAAGWFVARATTAQSTKPKQGPMEISYDIPEDKGGHGDAGIKAKEDQLKIYSEPPPPS